MPNLKLGKKSNNMYAVHISLPRGIVEMKSYCKVNGGMLSVSKSEFDFAMAAGMDKLISAEVISVGNAAPVVASPVNLVEVKAPIVEVKAEESMPVTSVQMTVEMSDPAEAPVEEVADDSAESAVEEVVEESVDSTKDSIKPRRRRA